MMDEVLLIYLPPVVKVKPQKTIVYTLTVVQIKLVNLKKIKTNFN